MNNSISKTLRPARSSIPHRLIASFLLLLTTLILTVRNDLTLAVLFLTSIVTVAVLAAGSLGRVATGSVIGICFYGAFLLMIDFLGINAQKLYPYSIPTKLLLLLVVVIATVFVKYHSSLLEDVICIAGSTLALVFLSEKELFESGGAFAALFRNEDNAAWVLMGHRAADSHPDGVGIFGPFFDLLQSISITVTDLIAPDLSRSDTLATAVVVLPLLLVATTPFLAVAILHTFITSHSRAEFFFQSLTISLGCVISIVHFLTIGHLSTAIASWLTLLAVLMLIGSESFSKLTGRMLMLSAITLTLAASVWFPISIFVLFVLLWQLMELTFFRYRRGSDVKILGKGILLLVLVVVISWKELITRFSIFQDSNSNILTGGLNLLAMEGGVASLGSLNTHMVLMLLIVGVLLTVISPGEQKDSNTLVFVVLGVASYLAMRAINLYSTGGQINYGVRKFETVMIMLGFIILAHHLLATISRIDRSVTSSIAVATAIIGVLFQLPASDQLFGRTIYAGIENEGLVQIGRAVATDVKAGEDVLCFTESYPFDRYFIYNCSRWLAAYSDTDSEDKNEWRKSVLGEIPIDQLSAVREKFDEDTILMIVGPPNDDLENNPEWIELVNPKWKQIHPD